MSRPRHSQAAPSLLSAAFIALALTVSPTVTAQEEDSPAQVEALIETLEIREDQEEAFRDAMQQLREERRETMRERREAMQERRADRGASRNQAANRDDRAAQRGRDARGEEQQRMMRARRERAEEVLAEVLTDEMERLRRHRMQGMQNRERPGNGDPE